MNPLSDETKVKAQSRYLMDLNQVRQTLDNNAIVPYRIDLTGRELVCYELKGGNILKLVSKPPEVNVFWNSTRDRGSAMLLNDLNRGIVANKLNKDGDRMFFENFFIWTEGIPNDINSDKHLYLEVAGVGNEITFLLGNQSHIELIASQMKAFQDMVANLQTSLNASIQGMNEAINASLLSNRLVLEEQAQYLTRLAMRQGAVSSADIVHIPVSLVKNPRSAITPPLISQMNRTMDNTDITVFKTPPAQRQFIGLGQQYAIKITPPETVIVNIHLEYRLINCYFKSHGWGVFAYEGKNHSAGRTLGKAYAMLNDILADTEGRALGCQPALIIGNYIRYEVGDIIASFSVPNVYLEKDKVKYLFAYINGQIEPNANASSFVSSFMELNDIIGWAAKKYPTTTASLSVTFEIIGKGDISLDSILPVVPEIPNLEEPQESIFIYKIIVQLIRTVDTQNDSIGLRNFQFVNFDNEVIQVIPNIVGTSGSVMFIIDGQLYDAEFSLDCNDAPDSSKNQIFEEQGWISGSTIKNRAYTMTLTFEDNNPLSEAIKSISVINGNAVLDEQGIITDGESWVQTIGFKLIDTSDKIIKSEVFNFGQKGMTAEIEVPQPIDPNIPTPPEPTPELGSLQHIEILVSSPKGSYNTFGAKELALLLDNDSLVYADTPLPANQSAQGSFMEGTFTIDNEVYNYKYQIYLGNGTEAKSYSDSPQYRKAYAMATTGNGYLGAQNSANTPPMKFDLKFDKVLPANVKGISMRNSSTNSSGAGFLKATVNFKDADDNIITTNEHTFTANNTIFQSLIESEVQP